MTKRKTIFDILVDALNQDPRLFREGKLFKNKVVELAYKMDKTMLQLLVTTPQLKQTFFEDIDGILVFDANKFQLFVSNKQFLPDSYTVYKNRIGLTTDDNLIMKRSDVVLVFPYKDCVLEGGQDKQDGKRDEIFYNETLAPDDITRLFEPKVLTNFRRIDAHNAHPLHHINDRDNLLIKGNNLLVLKCLERKYWGKIKLIYIDPPYNTGNDGFNYNDRFNHSTWLVFMKNRLETARNLLREDGVIFISCDDNEQAYLKVLCDEIFGRANFIATIPRKTRSVKGDVPYKLSQDFDWLVAFSKNGDTRQSLFKRKVTRKYYQSDDYPHDEWRLNALTRPLSVKERPNSDFTIVNPRNGDRFPVNPNSCWTITKDTFVTYYDAGKMVFPGDYDFLNISKPMLRIFKSEEIKKKGKHYDKASVSTNFLNDAMDHFLNHSKNAVGNKEIISFFGERVFSYPKPMSLIQKIIEITTEDDDIVLDFFVGSGTTGHAVLQQNHEDGGRRQCILVEQLDAHIDICEKRLTHVMQQHAAALTHQDANFVSCELMKLNQAYMDRLQEEIDLEDLLHELKSQGFVTYKLNLERLEKEFDSGDNTDKRRALLEMLDKNHLYLNLHDMTDTRFDVSAHDQRLNRQFYHLEKP